LVGLSLSEEAQSFNAALSRISPRRLGKVAPIALTRKAQFDIYY